MKQRTYIIKIKCGCRDLLEGCTAMCKQCRYIDRCVHLGEKDLQVCGSTTIWCSKVLTGITNVDLLVIKSGRPYRIKCVL